MNTNQSIELLTYLSIAPGTREEIALRLLVEQGIQVVGADEGSLLVFDAAADELVFALTIGPAGVEDALKGQRVPLGKGITGLAALTQEVQIGAPTYKDVRQLDRQGAGKGDPENVIAAPMVIGENVVGVITAVSFDEAKTFNQSDASVFGRMASIAALVIEQSRTLDAIRRLKQPSSSPDGLAPDERARLAITRSVARLAASRPEKVEQIVQLLDAIEALVDE